MTQQSFALRGRMTGFTLPEMLLSLGLTAVIAAGAFVLYSSGPSTAGADVEQANIEQITQAAYRAYGPLGTYHGVSTEAAITDGVFPSSMVQGAGSGSSEVLSVWNTPVTLSATTAAGKTDAGLAVTYQGVPKGACSVLVDGVADGLWDVRINGTSVMKDVSGPSRGSGASGQPIAQYRIIDFDAARAECLADNKDSANPTIAFVHYTQSVGSQMVVGTDSNNILWPPTEGGGTTPPRDPSGGGKGSEGGDGSEITPGDIEPPPVFGGGKN